MLNPEQRQPRLQQLLEPEPLTPADCGIRHPCRQLAEKAVDHILGWDQDFDIIL